MCPNYQDEGVTFKHDDKATYTSGNLMDQWIVSFTQSLLAFVHQEMDRTLVYNDDNSPPPPSPIRLQTIYGGATIGPFYRSVD